MKQSHTDKLADKLQSGKLHVSSSDRWTTLKHFLSPMKTSGIPTLNFEGNIITDSIEKAKYD